jgi:hypothetical protein
MVNNYLSLKKNSINSSNLDHFEIYFLNSLGERVNILVKSGINVIQALFKVDLEMILILILIFFKLYFFKQVMTQYDNVRFGNILDNTFLNLSIRITTIEKENIDRLKIIETKLSEMTYEDNPFRPI